MSDSTVSLYFNHHTVQINYNNVTMQQIVQRNTAGACRGGGAKGAKP